MNEGRILRILLAGVLAIVSVWATFWFLQNFERTTREVSSGYSKEARRNPFLAAERFLQRIGGRVESIGSNDLWRDLPSSDDTIVVYHYMPPAGEARRQALKAWVEAGGHLIVRADDSLLVGDDEENNSGNKRRNNRQRSKHRKPTGFLAELGVRVRRRSFSFDEEFDTGDRKESTSAIKFADYKDPVQVHFSPYRYLEDMDDGAKAAVPCYDGFCLLQYEVGQGLVTVLSDNNFLTNRYIGEHEHALALALLTNAPQGGKVWLVHDVMMPSLPELMWRYGPQAIVALLLALALWLWKLGARLGPALPPLGRPRRDIGEHLEASANYLWRIDGGQHLFRANQQRIEQAWVGKHYLLRPMSRAQRCEWIAARAGLAPGAVERALYGEYMSDRDFIELSSYLQILGTTL